MFLRVFNRHFSVLKVLGVVEAVRCVGSVSAFSRERLLRQSGGEIWRSSIPAVLVEVPLGDTCSSQSGAAATCGGVLVCRDGICSHCEFDEECPNPGTCVRSDSEAGVCTSRLHIWSRVLTDPSEFMCTVLIFFCATLAASAGTGGGGMFVPLLLIFSNLQGGLAVPLSQSMIFCSSFVNVLFFASQRHPVLRENAKIDYDCVVLLEPMLCLGVTLGVMVHQFSPAWLNILLLSATLGSALWRTAKKGWKQRQEELALRMARGTDKMMRSVSPVGSPTKAGRYLESRWDLAGMKVWLADYQKELTELTSTNWNQVIGIFSVWFVMLIASFHGIPVYTMKYGVYLLCLAFVLAGGTMTIGRHVIEPSGQLKRRSSTIGTCDESLVSVKPIDWVGDKSLVKCVRFPAVALAAGLLGGSLGLGGGIIVSPVLLEVGMHSEAVQATTAAFVFLSSSLATIQYVILGQVVWDYALWYGVLAVAATALGQHLCEVYVRRHQQYSAITLSIAGVLLFSLVSLVFVGIRDSLGLQDGHA